MNPIFSAFIGSASLLLVMLQSHMALAQAAVTVRVLELIGESSALEEAVVAIGEASPALKALARQAGIAASDTPKLAEAFANLPASQRGALALSDPKLGQAFLSSAPFRSAPRLQERLVSDINGLNANHIGSGLLPHWYKPTGSAYFINPATRDVLAFTPGQKVLAKGLHFDVGTREITLSRPITICTSKYCTMELSKIKLDDLAKVGVPAAGVCFSTSCKEKIIRAAANTFHKFDFGPRHDCKKITLGKTHLSGCHLSR